VEHGELGPKEEEISTFIVEAAENNVEMYHESS